MLIVEDEVINPLQKQQNTNYKPTYLSTNAQFPKSKAKRIMNSHLIV